jgi:hypothetical protein
LNIVVLFQEPLELLVISIPFTETTALRQIEMSPHVGIRGSHTLPLLTNSLSSDKERRGTIIERAILKDTFPQLFIKFLPSGLELGHGFLLFLLDHRLDIT